MLLCYKSTSHSSNTFQWLFDRWIKSNRVFKEMENPEMKDLTWEIPILQETWKVPGADKAKYGQIIFHAFLEKYPQHKATFPKLRVSNCKSDDFWNIEATEIRKFGGKLVRKWIVKIQRKTEDLSDFQSKFLLPISSVKKSNSIKSTNWNFLPGHWHWSFNWKSRFQGTRHQNYVRIKFMIKTQPLIPS